MDSTNGHGPVPAPSEPLVVAAGVPEEPQEAGLRSFAKLLRRRWRLILIPVIAVPVAAFLFSSQQAKQYESTTSLLFRDSQGSLLASKDPQREATTNVRLLELGVLANRIHSKLPGFDINNLKVGSEAESNLVTVTATDSSPARAARDADVVAREYIAFRRDQIRQDIAARERLTEGLLAAANSPTAKRALERRLKTLQVGAQVAQADVRQVRPATIPNSPASPKPVRDAAIGLFVGLILGLALAVMRERLDLRVRDPKYFETTFGRPILGRIPRSRALSKSPPGEDLPPVEAQAFADLRSKLRHHVGSPNGHGRSVVIASAEPSEGKTTVAWHLACAATGPRQSVLLIEADLRKPGLSTKLGTNGTPGLSDVLLGRASLAEAIRQVPVGSDQSENGLGHRRIVSVLFAGSPATDPTGLLDSPEMLTLLEQMGEHYDFVIIDTPPTSVATDAVPLVMRTDGVVVVGRLARSRIGPVASLSKHLREVDAQTIGVVVNSTEVSRDTYNYYYARPRV